MLHMFRRKILCSLLYCLFLTRYSTNLDDVVGLHFRMGAVYSYSTWLDANYGFQPSFQHTVTHNCKIRRRVSERPTCMETASKYGKNPINGARLREVVVVSRGLSINKSAAGRFVLGTTRTQPFRTFEDFGLARGSGTLLF